MGNRVGMARPSSLATQQLAQGLPVQSNDDVISDTQFLQNLNATSHTGLTAPTAADYADNPILQWRDCEADAPSADAPNPASLPSVDLVQRARAVIGPDTQLFADVSQQSFNMCTSMAFAQAYSLKYALSQPREAFQADGAVVPQLSAVYAYYYQRVEECRTEGVCACVACQEQPTCPDPCNPPCVDCGSYLRSAGTVFSVGVCRRAAWPYSQDINTQPSTQARLNALSFRVTKLRCVAVSPGMLRAVAASLEAAHPVVVFLNLTAAQTRWMRAEKSGTTSSTLPIMPPFDTSTQPGTKVVGHVVLIVAYDGTSQLLTCRNNFGNTWGAGGYFAIRAQDFSTAMVHSMVAVEGVCGPPPDKVSASTTYNPATTCAS